MDIPSLKEADVEVKGEENHGDRKDNEVFLLKVNQ